MNTPTKPNFKTLKPMRLPDGREVQLTQEQFDHVWSLVSLDASGCWIWNGRRFPTGYGRYRLAGTVVYSHRLMYMITTGPIEQGLHTDHLCRNPPCCNPEHLEPVTCRENIMRSPIAPAAINANKTHCKRGHPLSGSNVQVTPDGGRSCRTCAITLGRERYAAATGAPLQQAPIDLDAPTAPRRHRGAESCAKGHALDLLNTYVDPKGYKHCRACRAAAQSRYEARKKDRS
ncbi:hypothetical protein DT019_03085 [Streptomyces sp. SDr-06]|uniref:HNH endonuclease signature motif containing protein n=1 Tax=Streptomyces sp. SDr-06 TaxID=2267702 RepID=UPI000DE9FE27|nr:HNH endonuclease signature motif containing protein [Streptomyces sp. SDr-06]RCH70488.1 hypothetical protein DT019_03085 [Streptomyces sp. SDr-06]